jgi:hypothetical protein
VDNFSSFVKMSLVSVPLLPLDMTNSLHLRFNTAALISSSFSLVSSSARTAASLATAAAALASARAFPRPILSLTTFSLTTVLFLSQRARPLSSAYAPSSASDSDSDSSEDDDPQSEADAADFASDSELESLSLLLELLELESCEVKRNMLE